MSGDGSSKVLGMVFLAMCLMEMVNLGVEGFPICGVDSKELNQCQSAVTGKALKPPTKQCCNVLRRANLSCLCGYKELLPSMGIQPKYAFALPRKCGIAKPPVCH